MTSSRPSPIKSNRHPHTHDEYQLLHATIHTLTHAGRQCKINLKKLAAEDPCSLGGGGRRLGVCNVYAYKNQEQYNQPVMSCTQITKWYEM